MTRKKLLSKGRKTVRGAAKGKERRGKKGKGERKETRSTL
jgi:hypothetical protein